MDAVPLILIVLSLASILFLYLQKKGIQSWNLAREMEYEKKILEINKEREQLQTELISLKSLEPSRQTDYLKNIERLNLAFEHVESEHMKLQQEKELEVAERQQYLKESWARHENAVAEKIKRLSEFLGLDYVDKEKFPFKGKPDNSLKVANEFLIFDAKSPLGLDLSHFPKYIKDQAEAAKKYTKIDGIKKDIFFVVPVSAIESIPEVYLAMGDYRVFIITMEAILPILLQIKKVSEIEFTQTLSPVDRDKICAIIGNMSYALKRRVQIDQFMANEFFSILLNAKNLPEDIQRGVNEVTASSKINPPFDKRSKQIDIFELQQESTKISAQLTAL